MIRNRLRTTCTLALLLGSTTLILSSHADDSVGQRLDSALNTLEQWGERASEQTADTLDNLEAHASNAGAQIGKHWDQVDQQIKEHLPTVQENAQEGGEALTEQGGALVDQVQQSLQSAYDWVVEQWQQLDQ